MRGLFVLLFLLTLPALAQDHPRSKAEIAKTLKAIQQTAMQAKATIPEKQALAKLNGYRYLCGVAHDVTIHPELSAVAKAGARLLKRANKLEHKPENPGMPEAEYKQGFAGTAGSNLAKGLDLPEAVKAWMFDSDKKNIGKLGHRRWALNPTMQHTGFGQQAPYTTMYIMNFARKDFPDYDIIPFPAEGYMPARWFGRNWAWSVMPNPNKYRLPKDPEALVVEVFKRRKAPGGKGFAEEPVELDFAFAYHHWSKTMSAVIFRPTKPSLGTGAAYRVRIAGLRDARESRTEIEYVVEFFRL